MTKRSIADFTIISTQMPKHQQKNCNIDLVTNGWINLISYSSHLSQLDHHSNMPKHKPNINLFVTITLRWQVQQFKIKYQYYITSIASLDSAIDFILCKQDKNFDIINHSFTKLHCTKMCVHTQCIIQKYSENLWIFQRCCTFWC